MHDIFAPLRPVYRPTGEVAFLGSSTSSASSRIIYRTEDILPVQHCAYPRLYASLTRRDAAMMNDAELLLLLLLQDSLIRLDDLRRVSRQPVMMNALAETERLLDVLCLFYFFFHTQPANAKHVAIARLTPRRLVDTCPVASQGG